MSGSRHYSVLCDIIQLQKGGEDDLSGKGTGLDG